MAGFPLPPTGQNLSCLPCSTSPVIAEVSPIFQGALKKQDRSLLKCKCLFWPLSLLPVIALACFLELCQEGSQLGNIALVHGRKMPLNPFVIPSLLACCSFGVDRFWGLLHWLCNFCRLDPLQILAYWLLFCRCIQDSLKYWVNTRKIQNGKADLFRIWMIFWDPVEYIPCPGLLLLCLLFSFSFLGEVRRAASARFSQALVAF